MHTLRLTLLLLAMASLSVAHLARSDTIDCSIHDYDWSSEYGSEATTVETRTSSGRCSESLMGNLSSAFWLSQPGSDPSRWDWFFSNVDDNVEFGTNGALGTTVGKPIMEATFRILNAPNDFQEITQINSINNAFGVNRVHVKVNKTQISKRMGLPNSKRFFGELLFSPPGPNGCKVIYLLEYPEASVTIDQTLALEFAQPFALTCERIRTVCKDHMPNFGTWNNSCDLFWYDAPRVNRIWTPYGDGSSYLISHNLACVNIFLGQIATDEQAAQICPMFGAPIPNAFGCWFLPPTARSEELKRNVASTLPPNVAQLLFH